MQKQIHEQIPPTCSLLKWDLPNIPHPNVGVVVLGEWALNTVKWLMQERKKMEDLSLSYDFGDRKKLPVGTGLKPMVEDGGFGFMRLD